MTPAELKKLWLLLGPSSAAPWAAHHHEGYGWIIISPDAQGGLARGEWREADGDLIAAARNALPELLGHIDHLEHLRRAARLALEAHERGIWHERDHAMAVLSEVLTLLDGAKS